MIGLRQRFYHRPALPFFGEYQPVVVFHIAQVVENIALIFIKKLNIGKVEVARCGLPSAAAVFAFGNTGFAASINIIIAHKRQIQNIQKIVALPYGVPRFAAIGAVK